MSPVAGGYAQPSPPKGARLATLAFNREAITPRPLKPALLELDGISRESVEAHYKLVGAAPHTGSRRHLEPPV